MTEHGQTPSGATAEAPRRADVRVRAITWERVHLTIRVTVTSASTHAPPGARIDFEIVDGERAFPVSADEIEAGVYDIRLNVTTFVDRREIPNGSWRIRAIVDGAPDATAQIDVAKLDDLDDASRVFLFNGSRSVYTVSFGVSDIEDRLELQVRTHQFHKPEPRPRGRGMLRRVKRAFVGPQAKQRFARTVHWLFSRVVGPRPRRMLIASEQRPKIEGNLERVYERLVERDLADSYDIRYSFRVPATSGFASTIRLLYLLATSQIVLIDDYFALLQYIAIDERTKVIQLWHAGSGFKAVGFSRFGNSGSPMLTNPHRTYNYAITGSQHLVPVYAEAFGIEPEAVIPTGLPRVDWFLDEDRARSFREQFFSEHPNLAGKRIILFAPTFRGRNIKTAFYDYGQIDFDALYEAIGPDSAVLFRMHHFVTDPVPIEQQYEDRFFDFSSYPNGLELLHVVDLLITDYSSIIYEYSLLDRPILFFAPDKDNYAATRGFHRNFDDTAPGRVCVTFDEVIQAITDADFDLPKVARFRAENFDRVDTGSADRVIDWLILADPHPLARGRGHHGARDEGSDTDQGQAQEDESI